jgi:periplasmic protein TonB
MSLPVDRLDGSQLEEWRVDDANAAPVHMARQCSDARVAGLSSGRRSEVVRWILCFVIVAACHGIGALALVRNLSETLAAGVDANVVPLDLPEALTSAPVRDLPPGPPMEDYVPPTPQPKEDTKPPETETEVTPPKLEPEPPRPPEPPAEVALPMPEPEPPKPPEPKPPPEEQTAPAAARTPPRDVVRWQNQLGAHIDRFKRYPATARRGGTTTVAFTIDRQGRLVQSSIVESAGSPALDQEALATLARAAPMPHPPDDVTDAELTFTVSLHFNDR